jgi:drug/metabolite transporter (DMT)-like permease
VSITGVAFGIAAALGASVAAVATRKLKDTHFSVVLVNYAAFSLLMLIVMLSLKAMIFRESPSIFHYSSEVAG